MQVAVAAVLAVTLVASVYRWTWVSQKEHYLPPAAAVTVARWVRAGRLGAAHAALGGAAAAAALALAASGVAGSGAVARGAVALAAMVLCAGFPAGMALRKVRLRFTRRATLQACAAALLSAGVAAAAAVPSGAAGAAAISVALAPLSVDAAARLLEPVEERLARRYVLAAAKKLGTVSPRVVAITGSWGKTSTKNHLADLLDGTFQTVASPASWNNTAGLARTVNEKLFPGTEVLVLEMGTYGLGEIRAMCSWTHPEVAIICEIGPMHLERMKTVDTIVRAKAEITETAEQVVLWVENPHLAALCQQLAGSGRKLWRVGRSGSPGLDVSVGESGDRIEVSWGETVVGSAPLRGRVQPGNVACAAAAALALGLTPDRLAARLAGLAPPPHRAVVSRTERGVWVVDDTYNSNPAGASAAVARLAELGASGKRVVVTPGMVELGSSQATANRDLAAAVRASGAALVVVGRSNRADLLRGYGPAAVTVADREHARKWVSASLEAGDAVLWENDLPPHYP